MLNIVHK